jgi:amino acid transporter
MPDLSLWASWAQIISLPVAIVAILVSLWVYLKSKPRPALAYQFDRILSLIDAGPTFEGDIEIRYNGQAVENIFVVLARLKNVGNVAIRRSDIVEPVAFTFAPGIKLLRQPQCRDKTPKNLKVDWEIEEMDPISKTSRVSLDFDLLNPGDEFVVSFLCTGKHELPEVTARIEGITEMARIEAGKARLRNVVGAAILTALSIIMSSFGIAILLIRSVERSSSSFNSPRLITNSILLISGVIIGFLMAGVIAFSLQQLQLELIQYRSGQRKS